MGDKSLLTPEQKKANKQKILDSLRGARADHRGLNEGEKRRLKEAIEDGVSTPDIMDRFGVEKELVHKLKRALKPKRNRRPLCSAR